jgi:hypothetical protein
MQLQGEISPWKFEYCTRAYRSELLHNTRGKASVGSARAAEALEDKPVSLGQGFTHRTQSPLETTRAAGRNDCDCIQKSVFLETQPIPVEGGDGALQLLRQKVQQSTLAGCRLALE